MAKRSTARRKAYQRPNPEERTFRDRKTRNGKRPDADSAIVVDLNARAHSLHTAYSAPRVPAPLEARTPAEKRYINAIRNHCLTFGIGPAGTGKSYCAGALAAQALEAGQIDRIILTRPAEEAGEQLGLFSCGWRCAQRWRWCSPRAAPASMERTSCMARPPHSPM